MTNILQLADCYAELRRQENRITQITFINGSCTANTRYSSEGVCARAYINGSFGFASSPDGGSRERVLRLAAENARLLDRYRQGAAAVLPSYPAVAVREYGSRSERSQRELTEFLTELDRYVAKNCGKAVSRSISLNILSMDKHVDTTDGASFSGFAPRTNIIISLSGMKDEMPVSERIVFGGVGSFEENFSQPDALFSDIDGIYEALLRKIDGVRPEKGKKQCILDSNLAGILAHEAIGHTVESDFVEAGSAAAYKLGKLCASELVTLVDFAHTAYGAVCPAPVYADDEGTLGRDVVIIENGVMKNFLHDKASAMRFKTEPMGNARAYRFSDEPLVRMRNTAILPGNDKLSDMIASVEDGYYLKNAGNGQADATSEFMFAVTSGYEIKNGKLCRALLDTTMSGIAFDVLRSVTMISDEFTWVSAGMCGKKQPIPVGMGGPAIKCEVSIG